MTKKDIIYIVVIVLLTGFLLVNIVSLDAAKTDAAVDIIKLRKRVDNLERTLNIPVKDPVNIIID